MIWGGDVFAILADVERGSVMHFDAVLFVRFSARTSLEFRCFLVSVAAAAAASGAAAASVVARFSLATATAAFSTAASCFRLRAAIFFSYFAL